MDFELKRREMVKELVRKRYISKPEVISAMMKVPRHLFLPKEIQNHSYIDTPQQIGFNQTISAPHMVGIMAEKLDLLPGQKVLEVGGGSGYHAAVVAEIVGDKGHVYSIEYVEALVERARMSVKSCSLENIVTFIHGDGSLGYSEQAPYDRIYVTAASPDVPPPLLEQLSERGKLLIPSGSRYFQTLLYCEKKRGKVIKKDYGGCVFVPLVGKHGF